jgi:CelD/BcsL family acetyltransferase involved in cellulose biosynthesis
VRYTTIGMLEVRVHCRFEDVESLFPAWEALLEDAHHAEPVTTPQWFRAWWSVFGSKRRALRAVSVHDGKDLVGFVPLARRTFWYRPGIPFRRIELLPSGEAEAEEISSDYIGAIVRRGHGPNVAVALARALTRRKLGSWDELLMPAMNDEDPFVDLLAGALRDLGCRVDLARSGTCAYITLPATWDAYLAALPGRRRYTARRSLNDFHAWVGERPWAFRRVDGVADLAHGYGILKSLHDERWHGAGVFRNAKFSTFHDHVMQDLIAKRGGSLELSWLEVDGKALAAAYNIVYRGKVYFYQSGRVLDLPKNVRVGLVLQLLAIRRAIDEGRREYDFLNGESEMKQQLATGERHLVTLRAVRSSARARCVEGARRGAERVADALRERRRRSSALTTT